MPMKHIYAAFALLLSVAGSAQKVDLDRYYFTASYRDLPRLALDTSYRTFSINTQFSPNAAYILQNERPDDRIEITGWQKVRKNGDLILDLQAEDIAIINSDVKEREEILKDKNGKETGRRYYYHMALQYTFASRMQLRDYRGTRIMERILADRQSPKIYNSKEFATANEALNSFVTNAAAVTAAITSMELTQMMNNVSNMLNNDIGFNPRTVSDFLWILDSKKHPEYQAHRQAWAAFKQAMFQMRADKPLDEVAVMLKPVIDYFNKMKTRYNSRSKADRKMRYASYYNLAKIYYYLDRPDASLAEAGQLMINDYDEKDGRGLEAAANSLKQLFELNKVSSRHFPVGNDIQPGALSKTGY